MKKRLISGLVVSLVLTVGGLYASNMAFKLNYTLDAQGPSSLTGQSTLALPFNPQTNLLNASDLLNDIGGTALVQAIGRFDPDTNGKTSYTGTAGSPFDLVPAEGYFVELKPGVATQSYIVVGSHDPSRSVVLYGQGQGPWPGGSLNGQSFYAWPYHSVSNDASELLDELGGTAAIQFVGQVRRIDNGLTTYAGTAGTPFGLAPGEAYLVQVKLGVSQVQFIPAHY